MRRVVLLVHDMRSTHNVGSLLRTAEGLGVAHVYFSGYTPYPRLDADPRLPHLAAKIDKQIQKTALGAEQMVPWSIEPDISATIDKLKGEGFIVAALEQTAKSIALPDFQPPEKIAIVLGREVEGIADDILALCDITLEIPMFGQKESFNVVQAAAIALYHCRLYCRKNEQRAMNNERPASA